MNQFDESKLVEVTMDDIKVGDVVYKKYHNLGWHTCEVTKLEFDSHTRMWCEVYGHWVSVSGGLRPNSAKYNTLSDRNKMYKMQKLEPFKIRINSDDHFMFVQGFLIALGYKWWGDTETYYHDWSGIKWVFVSEQGHMTQCSTETYESDYPQYRILNGKLTPIKEMTYAELEEVLGYPVVIVN